MTAEDTTGGSRNESGGQSDEQRADDLGARRLSVGSPPATATVDPAPAKGETTVQVDGYWYDDEPGAVELRVSIGATVVSIDLDPTDARRFAQQVAEAARYAEEGE